MSKSLGGLIVPHEDILLARGIVPERMHLRYVSNWPCHIDETFALAASGARVADGAVFMQAIPNPRDQLKVVCSLDGTPHGLLLHVSLSYPLRDPSWEVIRTIKETFFGDVDAAMILPKAADYVNRHQHCFHLWELPKEWGIQ